MSSAARRGCTGRARFRKEDQRGARRQSRARSAPQRLIRSSSVWRRWWALESQDHTEDSVFGPGVPVTSTETFYWLDGGYFLVQHLRDGLRRGTRPEGRQLLGLRLRRERFRIIFFSNNGPFTEDGNRYRARSPSARSPSRVRRGSSTSSMRPGRSRQPDGTVSVAWWLRDKQGEWRPWMHNTFTRSLTVAGVVPLPERVAGAVRIGEQRPPAEVLPLGRRRELDAALAQLAMGLLDVSQSKNTGECGSWSCGC